MIAAPPRWPQTDGTPISCQEKLRMLQENHVELSQILQDSFDDAILMGVDEQAFRHILIEMVNALESPHQPGGR